jgi:hypothetical protein
MRFPKVNIIIFIVIFIIFLLYTKNEKKPEKFDIMIEQHKKEYDDALEKRIDEVKQTIPGSDAELLLEVNRPYHQDRIDERGWYGDVINCKETGSLEIYCKPKEQWIFPY